MEVGKVARPYFVVDDIKAGAARSRSSAAARVARNGGTFLLLSRAEVA
jgi:hypothetical protein